jgi:DNA-binding IclR family transcriptional regulator
MASAGSGRTLKTTEKSLLLLEYVEKNESATMAEICSEFGFTKSTTHGHLTTLLNKGYLVKDGEQYQLGMKLLKLGGAARRRNKYFPIIKKGVDSLAAETSEGVDFSVFEHGQIISVYNEVENKNDPNFSMGKHYHAHATAAGKAILAEFDDDRVTEILGSSKLTKLTENTITDRNRLFESLQETRERGYSINDEEYQDGLRAVGATVSTLNGRILGAIGVGGPIYRVQGDVFTDYLPNELIKSISKINEQIEEYGKAH